MYIYIYIYIYIYTAFVERVVPAKADYNIITKKWLFIFQNWILSKSVTADSLF